MKPLYLIAFCILVGTSHAQWKTETYNLAEGWNAIYLHGDATTQDTIENILPAAVTEVWRWNPNPNQVQFTTSPLIPSPGTPEWSVWRRPPLTPGTLTELKGGSAYLVKTTAAAAVAIVQSPLPPSAVWLRSGANLLGFPTYKNGANFPLFSDYFDTFPSAIAANSKIFRYPGGDLGPANPIQVFNPAVERVERNTAYWFEAAVVGNFYAPVEISFSEPSGLDFGRDGAVINTRLRNRTGTTVTVTMTPAASGAPPSGETTIAGQVPLRLRTFNTATSQFDEAPITAANGDVVLAAGASVEVSFGIDRGAMSNTSGDFYASLLQFTDSGNRFDICIPVRAQVGSLAGLWVGEATVSAVQSLVATVPASGTTTPRPYPLRVLIHIHDDGTVRLLSQALLGTLETTGETGLCTREVGLKSDDKASARRISVAHMPLDRAIALPITAGPSPVALGSTLEGTVSIPFNDPTNPFVHQYHPDHDNRDARPDGTNAPKGDGEESYSISRACSFQFTPTPPEGTGALGYSTSVIGGHYTEILTGPHKEPITLGGTFVLRRVSEIGTITVN